MLLSHPNSVTLFTITLVSLCLMVIILKPSWQIGGDGFGYYSYARSVLFDGDLDMENEFQMFDELYEHHTLTYWRTPLGKAGNPFAVGPALLWSPFVGSAYLIDQIVNFPDPFPLPGYNLPYQLAVGFGTWTYALLGLSFVFLGLKKLLTPWVSFFGVVSTFALSPLPFYLIYEPSMAHGLTVFASGLLFYVTALLYVRSGESEALPSNWFLISGASIGLAFLIRWQDVIFGIVPILILIKSSINIFDGRQKDLYYLSRIFLLTASFFILTFLQLLTWKFLYGSFVAIPQGTSFFDLASPHFFDFLFSGYHGLFAIHPLLLFGVLGLVLGLKKHRALILFLFAALLLQIYLNAGLSDWYGGGSFGARRMVSAFFVFAFGFALLFEYVTKKTHFRYILGVIVVVGAVFNSLLMVTYARKIIPLNAPTTLQEVYTAPVKLIVK